MTIELFWHSGQSCGAGLLGSVIWPTWYSLMVWPFGKLRQRLPSACVTQVPSVSLICGLGQGILPWSHLGVVHGTACAPLQVGQSFADAASRPVPLHVGQKTLP